MELHEIIINKIQNEGPVSFHDFMEMALYYPCLGYYTSTNDKIGVKGDFYTTPVITTLFGAMIARQIEEMWKLSGEGPFTIVEFGAGDGFLSHDILEFIKTNPRFYENVNYSIIEKSAVMQEREKSILHEKVSWFNAIDQQSDFTGCVLSNEVADNFSVHRVVMKKELMEVFVDYENGFVEFLKPADEELRNFLNELNVDLPLGFCTEINLQSISWRKEIATCLKRGYVLTIDYGYTFSELLNQSRNGNTLRCYNKHHVNYCPYNNIGRQDITSHVNFSAFHHWGVKYGLQSCGYTDQYHFLLSLGLTEYLRGRERSINGDLEVNAKELFLINSLLVDMGIRYKVMLQRKAISSQQLTGMRFAQQFN